MKKTLFTLNEVTTKINSGGRYFLAGDLSLLRQLPKGDWIGGSITYFMSEIGGANSKDLIQVFELPEEIRELNIKKYAIADLQQIPNDYPENGFSYILIPAYSEVHVAYAENCTSYEGLFKSPLIGWISGFDLSNPGRMRGSVVNGFTGEISSDVALVAHVEIDKEFSSTMKTINIFHQGNGDVITFDKSGFNINECTINGEKINFASYLLANNVDVTLPLVFEYFGERVNVSFNSVDEINQTVTMYAPVFKEIEYQLASPVGDYEDEFNDVFNELDLAKKVVPLFSCNCILNFLYAKLQGKKTGEIIGPMTFGEIAHVLLNQTLVYITIDKK